MNITDYAPELIALVRELRDPSTSEEEVTKKIAEYGLGIIDGTLRKVQTTVAHLQDDVEDMKQMLR